MKNWKIFNKKILIPLSILVLVAASYFTWQKYQTEQSVSEKIETAKAIKGNVSVSLNIDGKTVIKRQDLAFEIGGVIRGINVKEGDIVKSWQTLAYLDVREAQKNLENILRDYSKERNDFEEGGQVTYANTALTGTIERILQKNQWDLEKAVLDVELKNIAINKSYLITPMGGTVAQVNYQPGEVASAQNNPIVITVVDENGFHFESFIEDIEALKIKKDMPVRISLDAIEDEIFEGKVSFVSPLATIDENELSTYKVIIDFTISDQLLIDGLFGEAEVISKEVTDVIKIPNTAVTREDGKSLVHLNNDGTYEKKEIKLGFTNGKEVEVISGLNMGDEVVVWK
jgi:RND family efflux transporter MFP subunit